MPVLPAALALTSIADGSLMVAADERNNFSAIQTEANALLTLLGGGAVGQVLAGVGSTLTWQGLPNIADSTLGADAASFDFQSIPSTFSHLLLCLYLRTTQAITGDQVLARFNNDSGANYDSFRVFFNQGAGVQTNETLAATTTQLGGCPGANAPANAFGALFALISHYAGSANHKSMVGIAQYRMATTTTNQRLDLAGGTWFATPAAINRVTILPGANNLRAGSRATLYGVG